MQALVIWTHHVQCCLPFQVILREHFGRHCLTAKLTVYLFVFLAPALHCTAEEACL